MMVCGTPCTVYSVQCTVYVHIILDIIILMFEVYKQTHCVNIFIVTQEYIRLKQITKK